MATALTVTLISAFAVTACATSNPTAPSAPVTGARAATSGGGPSQDAALKPKSVNPQAVRPASLAHVPTAAPAPSSPTSPTLASYGTGIAAVPAAGEPV